MSSTKSTCRRSRDGQGNPVCISRPCSKCKEWRCKTHCKCGRQGTACGRHAPRRTRAMEQAPTLAPVLSAVLPVPRMPKLAVETFAGQPWHSRAVHDITQASSSVLVASYMYDHPMVHKALLRQLGAIAGFKCGVFVDKQQYQQSGSQRMGQMLRALRNAGADVFLCVGSNHQEKFGQPGHIGSMHMKALLVDNTVVYHGSANFTWSSEKNFELVMRMVGPPVAGIVRAFQALQDCSLTLKL